MKLIVALGNPGSKYKGTRHNAGFIALENFVYLAQDDHMLSATNSKDDFNAKITRATIGSGPSAKELLFAYPQTFMNDSGIAVQQIMQFYKIEPKDLIVLHDEIDLPLGTVRLTQNSGAAGHNGVKSIIEHLGTPEFTRIRIGIESREENRIPPTDVFVLQNFTENELDIFPFEEINSKLEDLIK